MLLIYRVISKGITLRKTPKLPVVRSVKDNLTSNPLIQKFRVKVVNLNGVSIPLVDSPTAYLLKKKKLRRELVGWFLLLLWWQGR